MATQRIQMPAVQPPPAPSQRRDFFVYAVDFAGLAAGLTQNDAIQVQADSNFELQKFTFFADVAAAGQEEQTRILPLVTIQITDTGTGRQLFNEPVAIPAIMGDGRIPFILPTTKLFSKNSSIAIQVANYSAAITYNLRMYLIGSKIFTYS